MTAAPTGLFQGLAPLLVNRTVIMTVAADGKGLLTLNVIPKKAKEGFEPEIQAIWRLWRGERTP